MPGRFSRMKAIWNGYQRAVVGHVDVLVEVGLLAPANLLGIDASASAGATWPGS